jgi:hypothetical protein
MYREPRVEVNSHGKMELVLAPRVSNLAFFYDNSLCSDITVEISDEGGQQYAQLRLHRVILALSSLFFRNLFCQEPKCENLVINVNQPRILSALLQLCYGRAIHVPVTQLADYLAAADYLLIDNFCEEVFKQPSLIDAVALQKILTSNAPSAFKLVDSRLFSLPDILARAQRAGWLGDMPREVLLAILSHFPDDPMYNEYISEWNEANPTQVAIAIVQLPAELEQLLREYRLLPAGFDGRRLRRAYQLLLPGRAIDVTYLTDRGSHFRRVLLTTSSTRPTRQVRSGEILLITANVANYIRALIAIFDDYQPYLVNILDVYQQLQRRNSGRQALEEMQ